jgi:hypothetical protein
MRKFVPVLIGLACVGYLHGRRVKLSNNQDSSQESRSVESELHASVDAGQRPGRQLGMLQKLLLSVSPAKAPIAVPHARSNRAPAGHMITPGGGSTATLARPRYRKPLHEFEPKVQKAVTAVTRDLKNILDVEPNWDCFAKDAVLRDPTGTVISLHMFKQLLRAMRKFQKKWVKKQQVSVETRMLDNTVDPEMLTEGSIRFDGMGLPIPTPFGAFSLRIDGTCKAHFNQEGKITDMLIERWFFNGKRIQLPVLRHGSPGEKLSFDDKATLLSWAAKAIAPR